MSADLDRGFEWCCGHCSDLGSTPGYFDPGSGAAEPPSAVCVAEACPVDVPALRELEAQVGLAASFLSGACRIASVRPRAEIIEALAEALADGLEELYGEAARVPHAAIRSARVAGAQHAEKGASAVSA